MGQFSWIYSDTERPMIDDLNYDSFLLVPPQFHDEYGVYIKETCYEGYGVFDGLDVYELVADWNKDSMTEELLSTLNEPYFMPHDTVKKWLNGATDEEMEMATGSKEWKRWIGICFACYDKDNVRLPYPIKITEKPRDYNSVMPSMSDPDQGWGNPDYEE